MRRASKTWQARTRTRMVILLVLLIIPMLDGCGLLAPKTAALEKIHATYRTDFQQLIQLSVPEPAESATRPKSEAGQTAFAETLRQIRDYRVKYGETSQEAAHLKVLEGMIYLQSNQFGMARLVATDVAAAQSQLKSGTGDYARDQLLAMTFSDLISGWEEIAKFNDTTPGHPGGDLSKLIGTADDIKAQLDGLNQTKLAKPEVDEGAIYIATNAAIFYVWVYSQCKFQGQNPTPPCIAPNTKQQWFGKGRELIGKYLSDIEKKAAQGEPQTNVPAGRLRYLSWYGFLGR